jgi:BirA family biotin operon repressor/biotin-[acetyl-CoA-carboxylase] ligase
MIIGSNLLRFDSIQSTNTKASMLIRNEDVPEGTVVYTGFQTAGKGQAGNTWESEQGKNLLLSIILYPESVSPENQFIISMTISLGISDFIDKYHPGCRIKWPNDIYLNDKKIAGILIENSISGSFIKSSVAGIGLNINQENFPSYIPNAGSLKQVTGKEFDLEVLLKELLSALDNRYKLMLYGDRENIRREYISKLYRLNEWSKYRSAGSVFKGRIITISNEGLLIIENPEGSQMKFSFKELDYLS